MSTTTQQLQSEINSMGLVDLLNSIKLLGRISSYEGCPALYALITKRIKELDKIAFDLLKESHNPLPQSKS